MAWQLSAAAPWALVALLAGCAATPPAAPPGADPAPSGPMAAVPDLDQRALLLLLAHRGLFEPFAVEQTLDGEVPLRRELAATLGRVASSRVVAPLRVLLQDPEPEVRRAAAFSLGLVGDPEGMTALLRAVADPDGETGALAVEALARLEAPLAEALTPLAPLPEAQRWGRLLPALFRFREEATVAAARQGLEVADPGLRSRAAYALARYPRPEAALLLRPLISDPDPWVRGWAARALGQVGDGDDLARLLPLLEDPAPGPRIQALRAGDQLVADGRGAPPDSWRSHLVRLLEDAHPGPRVTALEIAGHWLPDQVLGDSLIARAREGHPRERQLALLALAQGRHPQAPDLAASHARSPDPVLRANAATAWGLLGRLEPVRTLRHDEAPRVRVAALHALEAAADEESAAVLALEALADEDPTVRATALAWLAENPRLGLAPLLESLGRAWEDSIDDARLNAVRALVARAQVARAERGRIVVALEELMAHPQYLLRREAAVGLARLGVSAPSVGTAHEGYPMSGYRDLVLRTRVPREVEMVTSRGTVTLRLECPSAPLTCANFLQLANQGFYDGLSFHRVVPDFVVQGGDPRGDGWGGPGYALRDELNALRYQRGVVGMAHSGPDTAGSQFFITLSDQPHLDGSYTAFGRVVSGLETLDSILQGDEIVRVRERP